MAVAEAGDANHLTALALIELSAKRLETLPIEQREVLLRLPGVQHVLELPPESAERPATDDAVVRWVAAAEVRQDGRFSAPEQRFLATFLNLGSSRGALPSGQRWKDDVARARLAYLPQAPGPGDAASDREEGDATPSPGFHAVRMQLRRRHAGDCWDLVSELAAALRGAGEDPGGRRQWVYGANPVGPEEADGARLVLFTAHHGAGLRVAVSKYQRLHAPNSVAIDFNDELARVGREVGSEIVAAASGLPPLGRELSWMSNMSRRTLHWAWHRTLDRVWPQVLSGLRDHRTVLLMCSATIYHEDSGVISTALQDGPLLDVLRLSRSEPRHVIAALSNTLVVTLIDDVYDCFARLSDVGQPFDPSLVWADHYPTRSAAISVVLEWARREVLDAERLARLLDWRHVLLPSKQPAQTLHRIIEGRPIVLFSHPTTVLRPAGGERFGDEQRRVVALAGALATHEDVAVIDPSAIDENRFAGHKERSDQSFKVTSLRLLPRWLSAAEISAAAEHLLWEPVAEDRLDLLDQPFTTPPSGSDDPARFWSSETEETLQMLRVQVLRQERFRHRLLVNQANGGLFVYRPNAYDDGQIRPALIEELKLRGELLRHETRAERRSSRRSEERYGRPVLLVRRGADEVERAARDLAYLLSRYLIRGVQSKRDDVSTFELVRPWVQRHSEPPLEPAAGDGAPQGDLPDGGVFVLDLAAVVELVELLLAHDPDASRLEPPPGLVDPQGPWPPAYAEIRDELTAALAGRRPETRLGDVHLLDEAITVAGSDDLRADELARRYVERWRRIVDLEASATVAPVTDA